MSKRSKAAQAEHDAERERAREWLRNLIKPGERVYGRVEHVSKSGMSRIIRLEIATVRNGRAEIIDITGFAATATDATLTEKPTWGIRVPGCGMDMVYHAAMNLSYALHGFGRETDDAAQVAARTGELAPGVTVDADCPPESHRSWRRAGYTLDIQR